MAEISNSRLYNFDTGILKQNACVVIVRTEWNAAIVDKLDEGCTRILAKNHVKYRVVNVPGAFEIPFGIKSYWNQHSATEDQPDAFVALACIIKGGTPHFDYVCKGITDGIVHLNLSLPVPTIFGVLTVDSIEQAEERIGGVHGHKGEEAAITALKMITLNQTVKIKDESSR
ncbi:MAG: 6,7-dimethyl-8-ribityllumazine synthase [Chitinophagaceae bacterium]|nr:6,7-dimethyl-8-ribityllumazine synthase [Chitinophagaceae bacterium]